MTPTRHMNLDDFEARYCAAGDPWGYETSDYERRKYDATLRACGAGPFAAALELGSSIGVFSARLSASCRKLVTIDGAATAVVTARRRLAGAPQVEIVLGTIPEAIPPATYDLVVASEILYYLAPTVLRSTLTRLHEVTRPGTRVVAVHWRPAGPERPFTAAEVHTELRAQPWLTHLGCHGTDDYLLDVLERR